MRIELHIDGMGCCIAGPGHTAVFQREWPTPPRKGDLVHLVELSVPIKWGLIKGCEQWCPRNIRVDDVVWGPFEDMDDVDVIVKCRRPVEC